MCGTGYDGRATVYDGRLWVGMTMGVGATMGDGYVRSGQDDDVWDDG